MTHHLDGVPGLLAPAASFYHNRNYQERAVYALEWVNSFAHTPTALRGDLKFRGGTAAQLHFGNLQRLSRDIDLVGSNSGAARIADLLDAVADRYGRQLFTWEQRPVTSPAVPMEKYWIHFPSATAGSPPLNLSLDITFMPLSLPVVSVLLSQSRVYQPSNLADAVETWTPAGFVADKLPTLGFNTHGYGRPVLLLPGEAHPENIWKQLHDLTALSDLRPDLAEVLGLYVMSIEARNAVRPQQFTPQVCLADAMRVCRLAAEAAETYPSSPADDTDYMQDALYVREGQGAFGAYLLGRGTSAYESRYPARIALLIAGLLALSADQLDTATLESVTTHASEVADRVSASPRDPASRKIKAWFRDRNLAWTWPVEAPTIFARNPLAAIHARLATALVDEAAHLTRHGTFSLE